MAVSAAGRRRAKTGGALLRLSQGSYAGSILGRNTVNRVLAMDLHGFFESVYLCFFKANQDGEFSLSPQHMVMDVAVTPPGSGGRGVLKAEVGYLRRMLRLIRERGVRAISANDPYLSGLNAYMLSRLTGVPYVVEVVSNYDLSYQAGKRSMPFLPSRAAEKRVERLVLRNAAVVYADRDYYKRYAERNGARPDRLARVRCVTDSFYYSARPQRCVEAYLPAGGRPVLLSIGRLAADKYCLDLAECLHGVRAAGHDVLLAVAGDGPERATLEQRATELGVRDSLFLLGNRNAQELVDLANASQGILATHMGYALLEAALSGTPIVAYDYEWHPEVVRHGETGLLVPFRDAAAMAAAAVTLLEDRESAEQMGQAARRFAREQHDPTDAVRDERRIFEGLLGL